MLFQNILIIGLGLLGGSIAKSIKKKILAKEIYAITNRKEVLIQAQNDKVIDGGNVDFDRNLISKADLIIIAVHLDSYNDIFKKIVSDLKKDAIIMDVGSVKSYVIQIAKDVLGEKFKQFVATHPIAGKEVAGYLNSDADLFQGQKTIIASDFRQKDKDNYNNNYNEKTYLTIEKLWQKIGSEVVFMESSLHDKIYSGVSHVVQLLCFLYYDGYVNYPKIESFVSNYKFFDVFLDNIKNYEKIIDRYSFKSDYPFLIQTNVKQNILDSYLRLVKSNLNLWKPIFYYNQKNIQKLLDLFLQKMNYIYNDLILKKNKEEFISYLQKIKLLYKDLNISTEAIYNISPSKDNKEIIYFFENYTTISLREEAVFLLLVISIIWADITIEELGVEQINAYKGQAMVDFLSIIDII